MEKNVARLVESDDGFPHCSTMQVIDVIHDLCRRSAEGHSDGKSLKFESAGDHIMFFCEYRKDTVTVGWRFADKKGADVECGDPGGDIVVRAPGFNFTPSGRMKSIEFWGPGKDREIIPYRNCRVKAAQAKSIAAPPATMEDFLQKLGRSNKDPEDFATANLLCLTFDSSPLWVPWRERYFK